MDWVIGVDIGGTHTEAVAINQNGNRYYSKVPTTPGRLWIGVLDSIKAVAEKIGITPEDLLSSTAKFAHGTTQTVNAFVQRSGAKVGLITTKGFRDHVVMMKGRRGQGLPDEEARRFSRLASL